MFDQYEPISGNQFFRSPKRTFHDKSFICLTIMNDKVYEYTKILNNVTFNVIFFWFCDVTFQKRINELIFFFVFDKSCITLWCFWCTMCSKFNLEVWSKLYAKSVIEPIDLSNFYFLIVNITPFALSLTFSPHRNNN